MTFSQEIAAKKTKKVTIQTNRPRSRKSPERMPEFQKVEGKIKLFGDFHSYHCIFQISVFFSATSLVCLFEKLFGVFETAGNQAKVWIQLDSTKSTNLHAVHQKFKEMHRIIIRQIENVEETTKATTKELAEESETLQRLLKREERVANISSSLFEVEKHIAQQEDELGSLQKDVQSNHSRLDNLQDVKAGELSGHLDESLRTKDVEVNAIRKDLCLKKFFAKVLKEDLAVEMEVQPSIIRHTNHLQEKCESLEDRLSKSKWEKSALCIFLDTLREERNRVESELLREGMLMSSLETDMSKRTPSVLLPLHPAGEPLTRRQPLADTSSANRPAPLGLRQ